MHWIATIAVGLTACAHARQDVQTAQEQTAAQGTYWSTTIALDAGEKLGGLAIGDVDPRRPGSEIVVVSESGAVRVLSQADGSWSAEVVFRAPGEMVQVAVGDVDPASPGDEIVAVGMLVGGEGDGGAGAAWILRREGGATWRAERVLEAEALVHGACAHDGAAFVTGYDGKLWRITRSEDPPNVWQASTAIALPGAGKAALSTPRGVVVACTDGSLVLAKRSGDGWEPELLDKREVGRSRLGLAGERVIVADDDGTLSIVANGERTTVHREADKLRGAVLADLVPQWPGLEAATAGYGKTVTVLRETDAGWTGVEVCRDSDRFHHLAAANLDDDAALELVACGYSGRVFVIERKEP